MNPPAVRLLLLLLLASLTASVCSAAEVSRPRVTVPGLEISLFAAEPEIVTPTGIAVDDRGRVFVIENNTHQVKPGYPGHPHDRVKILEDTDGDGKADRSSIFADGFRHAMNLRFLPDGGLLLVHRNGVVRLDDADGNGTAEATNLLRMETKADYPHNGLSGIVFNETDGWLYIGSGENFGEVLKLTGADGKELVWHPGGAIVVRMKPDGTQLNLHAWGMWNNFSLECDGAGRLFSVDNDPDSLPPCRLLHVVRGGDYGFQFQYGRAGLHPYQSWNGEIPGTLPMAAGTGEAPTGILDARRMKLGAGREQGLLVTGWGDSTLEWYKLQSNGATVVSQKEVIAAGDTTFRPACLAGAPDGSVYVTDWADREYSVHDKGRIWRLKATEPDKTGERIALPLSKDEFRAQALLKMQPVLGWVKNEAMLKMIQSEDPFVFSAAVTAMAELTDENADTWIKENAAVSPLGVLLAQRRRMHADAESILAAALTHSDRRVRLIALQWTGEGNAGPGITERKPFRNLRPLVDKALEGVEVSPDLFRTWLATIDLIERSAPITNNNAPKSFEPLVLGMLTKSDASPALKIAAIRSLREIKGPAIAELMRLTRGSDEKLRAEAVRSLGFVPCNSTEGLLQKLAADSAAPLPLRLDALNAVSGCDAAELEKLVPLLGDPEIGVRRQAVRTLRLAAAVPAVRAGIEMMDPDGDAELAELKALSLGQPSPSPRPADAAAWTAALDATHPADPENGRRIFLSKASLCATCHAAEGRGGNVGPDLSTIARSSSRERLVQSILQPSATIGPLYVVKTVKTKKGESFTGIPLPVDSSAGYHLLQPDASVVKISRPDVAAIEDSPVSLMPQGLENTMTVQDLRDLTAWMLTLK